MQRWPLYLLAPTFLVLVVAIAPLALGERTLFHRDVLGLHFGLKAAAAPALLAGELPLVDMVRTTGEPLLGNANGLPLYPTNLLYLVAPFTWAFNAHFWLHWLLAPLAFYWLARAFGLGRGGASAAAVFWATGGFFVSQLNFYNLAALVALAPAFVASWLEAAAKPRYWAVAAILLALLILAGDPFSALLALAIGALALFFRPAPEVPISWRGPLLSLLAALLLAAPGVIELMRILPTSLRQVVNRDFETSLDQSLEWVGLADLFLPFFLGNFDMTLWATSFFRGSLPFFPTLFPGVLAIAAAIAGCGGERLRRSARWALLLLAGGLFFALGEQNPLVVLLYQHVPGFSVLRFPIKFMMPPMVAVCLLGGIGFERFLTEGEPGRRALSRILGALTAGYSLALVTLILLPGPVERWLRALEPRVFGAGPAFDNERARWSAILLMLVAVGLLAFLCARMSKKSLALSAALMLALASVFQLELLKQLYRGADISLFDPPPALAAVPESSLAFHRSRGIMQPADQLPRQLIDEENDVLMARCAASELAPGIAVHWHRRFALTQNLDYLDSYLGYYLSSKVTQAKDQQALPVLAALGVDRLLSTSEISAEAAPQVELLGRFPSPCRRELFVYRLRQAATGNYLFPGNIRRAADLESGFASLATDPLDAHATVLLLGQGDVADRPPGTIGVIAEGADSFELEVDSAAGGVLVARRNWLPFYRAWVNGEPARLRVANLIHLGLELPAGRHHVLVEADRRPTRTAFAAAGLTLLAVAIAFFRLSAKKGAPENGEGGSMDPPSLD